MIWFLSWALPTWLLGAAAVVLFNYAAHRDRPLYLDEERADLHCLLATAHARSLSRGPSPQRLAEKGAVLPRGVCVRDRSRRAAPKTTPVHVAS